MRIHEREDLRLTFRKRPAAHAGVELTCRAQAILCRQCGKKTARRVGESANRSSAKTVQSKLPRREILPDIQRACARLQTQSTRCHLSGSRKTGRTHKCPGGE